MSNYTDLTLFDDYVSFNVKGKRYLISIIDMPILDSHNWYIRFCDNIPYLSNTRHTPKFFHRLVMNPPLGHVVDHINGDVTDNRRENLRVCTQSQNSMNRGNRSDNTTGYKGVYYKKRDGKFVAQIKNDGIKQHIGRFDTAEDANKAYCEAELKYFGEYARKNGGEE